MNIRPRNINCRNCKEIVNRPPCHTSNKENVYCNRKCYLESIRKNRTLTSNYRERKRDYVCIQCNKPFVRRPHNERQVPKFCSIKCFGKTNGKLKRMENHWNWKGGIGTRHLKKIAPRPRPELCEICGDKGKKRDGIVLDHDHKTNKFRGWICSNCNSIIGFSHESTDTLRKIINYINENSL